MKKIIALLLAIVMVCSFAGCGRKSTVATSNLDEAITINWLMPGPGKQVDSGRVWAAVNDELHKIDNGRYKNVTLKIEVIPVSDYQQKVLLMQTSGEPMDLVQTYRLDFATEYRNGSFLDLTDYMQFAPDAIKELPEWVIDMGKVDGAQAIIPNYQQMGGATLSFAMPKELADKYADAEKMREIFQKADYFDDSCREVVEEYLMNVKEAGKIAKGLLSLPSKGTENVISNVTYKLNDKDTKLFNTLYSSEEYVKDAKWKQKLFRAGLIREDVLSTKANDYNGLPGEAGGVGWYYSQWTSHDVETYITNANTEAVSVPMNTRYFVGYKPAAGGTAISATSKHPDIAMEIINLMNSKKGIDIYNLLVYGFEGEHYKTEKILPNGLKYITPVGYTVDGTSSANYGIWQWVVGNVRNSYLSTSYPEDFKENIFDIQNEGPNTEYSRLMGFAPVVDTLETKMAQIQATQSEYNNAITSGVLDDVDTPIKEMRTKLKAAGVEDVVAEMQRQVDEFLASK